MYAEMRNALVVLWWGNPKSLFAEKERKKEKERRKLNGDGKFSSTHRDSGVKKRAYDFRKVKKHKL
jgi:hypothetical protein